MLKQLKRFSNKITSANFRMNYFFATIIFIFPNTGAFGQASIEVLSEDRFEIIIEDDENSPITILQVTDLHLGGTNDEKWKKDLITFRRIRKLVETYDPSMIAITGDLFTGEKPFGALLAAYAMNFFDSFNRPWLYVFGNHDPEGGFGRSDIAEVFSESKWAILGNHSVNNAWKVKYDYLVNIKLKGENNPEWQIYAFDSGSEKGYKSIKEDQLNWYRKLSSSTEEKYNQKIRAISIFHIPLIEYQYLQDDKSIKKYGECKEKVYYEEDNAKVYKTFLEVGNIEATFCGHDHYNNCWGRHKGGITLAYGYISGESTNYAWPPGGKLITLPCNKGEILIQNVVPILED